jgi:hypothetical protein
MLKKHFVWLVSVGLGYLGRYLLDLTATLGFACLFDVIGSINSTNANQGEKNQKA